MTDNAGIQWPQKTREFHNHHFDSTIWNDFKFREAPTTGPQKPGPQKPGSQKPGPQKPGK